MTKEQLGRLILEASTGQHGGVAKQLSDAWADMATLAEHRLHTIRFVERWAVHHGTKPHMTAEEALSVIQHYPAIKEVTRSYVDGKVPDTADPWAALDQQNQQLREQNTAVDVACAALARREENARELLLRAEDFIEAQDGTSVENEKLVDDYRAWKAKQ